MKFKFECEQDFPNNTKIAITTEAITLGDIVEEFGNFLHAVGFRFEHLEVLEKQEDPIDKENREFHNKVNFSLSEL